MTKKAENQPAPPDGKPKTFPPAPPSTPNRKDFEMVNYFHVVNLGDHVVDSVSGFQGIAVSRHSYLQGCDRITVQPRIDKDGKLPECETFDVEQLKVVDFAAVQRSAPEEDPGGPEKYSDNRRY